MRPTATRRGGSPLRPLLRLLPLLLTLAAHATAGVGVEWQRPMAETTPQNWIRLRRDNAASREDNHRSATSVQEVPDGSRGRDKGDKGNSEEPDVICNGGSTGEDKAPCERQPPGLRPSLRAARSTEERLSRLATAMDQGEEICLKEETRNPIRRSLDQPGGEYSDLFDEGIVNLDEISNLFCSSGSILVLSASFKRNKTDLSGMLRAKVRCAAANVTRNRESIDDKNEERKLGSFMDIISGYISPGWRSNGHRCSVTDIKVIDLKDFLAKGSECSIPKSLPEVVQGIKCRYDLIEGAVNDIGKKKKECEKRCRRIAGRTVCSCIGSNVKGSSMAVEGNESSQEVRYCKPLLDPTVEECPPGYDLDVDSRVCVDIDECAQKNGGCSHECVNTNGGYRCKCPPGHFLMEDRKSCDTRDECAEREDGRTFADCAYRCINRADGFMCTCPEGRGYQISSVDAKSCVHLEENYTLTVYGIVYQVPTIPAKEGKCPEGFSLDTDNATCTDIDECHLNVSGCPEVCENLYGTYRCLCGTGFRTSRDRKWCKDIDECKTPESNCERECVNTEGSYRCECPTGYRLREDGRSCVDVDECREKTHGCSEKCWNSLGSFRCDCRNGYYLLKDRKTCHDLDECEMGVARCEQGCENTAGSFRCKCGPGYVLASNRMSCLATGGARRAR